MQINRYSVWPASPFRQVVNQLLANGEQHTDSASLWSPRVDIREEAQRFVILVDVPGVDPASIELDMDKGVLSIRGERVLPALDEGQALTRAERQHGAFSRRFNLPDSADAEAIVASSKHGVLEIAIPKRSETQPRRIQING